MSKRTFKSAQQWSALSAATDRNYIDDVVLEWVIVRYQYSTVTF